MAASSAPAVKASLLTILRARAGLTGVQIEWSLPAVLQQEAIWLGKVSDRETDEFLRPNPRAKQEDYTIECIVFCQLDGDDPQTVETRWWTLVGEVEAALQADPTVGGTLNQWALIEGIEQRPAVPPNGGGRVSEGEVSIGCHHRK